MNKIVPDDAETELPEFPRLDLRIPPANDEALRLGRSPLAPSPEPQAPELPPGAEEVISYDENPVEEGHIVPRLEPEDEALVDAELIEEGLDQAERDLRKNARKNTPTIFGPDNLQ